MQSTWVTLYDASRDSIGVIPWAFAVMWLVGLCAGGIALKALGPVFRETQVRFFLPLWLIAWALMGGFGVGNVFYQYAVNLSALRTGSSIVTEGPIVSFHRQNPLVRADSERFVVNGTISNIQAPSWVVAGLEIPPALARLWKTDYTLGFGTATVLFAALTHAKTRSDEIPENPAAKK